MIAAGFLVGAGLGLGVLLLTGGLVRRSPPLASALAALHAPPTTNGSRLARRRVRLAREVARGMATAGLDPQILRFDLRVADRALERHLLDKLGVGVAGLALPPVVALLAAVAGVRASPGPVAVASLALAAGGFFLPDTVLRKQAAERRRRFRYALSSYLDLVGIILAAGVGVETALLDAAESGDGWEFAQLRAALRRSRMAGSSPWVAFRRLGEDLEVPELRELASSLALTGTHGAKVKTSLAARAKAMRARDLADMEAQAESATERMSVPTVVLVLGFITFVGFPAAYEILGF